MSSAASGLYSAGFLMGQAAMIAGESPLQAPIAAAFRETGARVALHTVTPDLDRADNGAAEAFDSMEAEFGPIGILVVCPPATQPGERLPLGDWALVRARGYDDAFFLSAEFARRRLGAGNSGSILYLAWDDEDPVVSPFDAALADGVGNLAKSLGVEWARDGIRVNRLTISPSAIAGNPEVLRSLAAMSLYLCSPFAGFVTGASLRLGAIG